jgi:hypothetical protein
MKHATVIGGSMGGLLIERQNLSMRMGIRRFTRLTNAFQQEVGEPLGSRCGVVRLLQLLQNPQISSHYSGDVRGHHDHVWELAELPGGVIRLLRTVQPASRTIQRFEGHSNLKTECAQNASRDKGDLR